MKCAIRCESLLLQKAIEKFLYPHVTSFSDADIVVCDKKYDSTKPVLIINKPFTKEELYNQIDRFIEKLDVSELSSDDAKWGKIEPKIEKLTTAYVKKLMEIIQENYERK